MRLHQSLLVITIFFIALSNKVSAQGFGYTVDNTDTINISDRVEQSIIFYEYSSVKIFIENLDTHISLDTYDLDHQDSAYISMVVFKKNIEPMRILIDGVPFYLDKRNGYSIDLPINKNSVLEINRRKKLKIQTAFSPPRRNSEPFVELALFK